MVNRLKVLMAQPDHWTLKASQSLSIRVRDWTPKVDQETSTTHLVRSWSTSLNNLTTIISTVTKANSIHLSKNSRPKCANTILRTMPAHLHSIASLPMDLLSSDSQMTLSQRTLVRPLSVLSTPTTKLSLARTEANANSVTAAHSITTTEREESWSTHFQIFQKVSLFLQCLRRWRATTAKRETTMAITSTIMFLLPSSTQTTTRTRTRWSKSPPSLIWLLFLVISEDSTQTSTCLLCQLVSTTNTTWTDLVTCHHTWCTNSKCRCKCTSSHSLTANQCHSETRPLETPILLQAASQSILRPVLQTKMVKDMRRKIKTALPKSLQTRKGTSLSQKSTWPSKRRTRTRTLQPKPPPTKSLLRTSLQLEPRQCRNDTSFDRWLNIDQFC